MSRTISTLNRTRILTAAALTMLGLCCAAPAEPVTAKCSVTGNKADALESILFDGSWPGKKDVYLHPEKSLHEFASCELKIFWPEDAPDDAQVLAFVKDWDFFWYQNLLPGHLRPGATNTCVINFIPSAKGWEARGHYGGWNLRSTVNPSEVGFSILSKKKYEGKAKLISAAFTPGAEDTGKPEISNVRINESSLPCYDKLEINLDLLDRYPNPFDSASIRLYAEFVLPDGSEEKVDGFFKQDYYRKEDSAETRISPQGKPGWCIRFSPWKEGRHSFRIIAEDSRGTTQWGPGSFTATAGAKPGFVRVSRKDPRFFEFDSKAHFSPIGHNIRSPFDTRMDRNFPWKQRWPEGSSAYERYFSEMKKSGQNMAEVWFASWSMGLEWNRNWFGYHGVGQYNLIHAFEMDRVIDLADENGIYVNLVIHNHGKFSSFSDPEWESNPFNAANGGWLNEPFLYFTDEKAVKTFLDLMRYTVARWGYSPRVFAWQLWSELDLVGSEETKGVHRRPETVSWHQFTSDSIKEMDPYDHMVSSHVCGDYSHQNPDLISLRGMDLCPVDAYHGSRNPLHIVNLLMGTADFNNPYKKPVLVTEFGGSPQGGTTDYLEATLHAALWASACVPVSGAPMFWWWGIIEEENYYPIYRAFSNFMKGVDRRDPDAKCYAPAVACEQKDGEPIFSALAYQGSTNGLGWIYYTGSLWDNRLPAQATAKDLELTLSNLSDGTYEVEFWDTKTGETTSSITAECSGGRLAFKMPVFTRDAAFKIRLKSPAGRSK